MQILWNEVSENVAAEITRIFNYIGHDVDFTPLPLDNPIGFGQADWTTSPNWTVRSVTDLPQPYFEANLLHELYHLCQIFEGYPTTQTKTLSDLSSQEQEQLDNSGRALTSMILDLDVCDRIHRFGLNSDYFFNLRYNQAKSISFENIDWPRSIDVRFTVNLAGIILQNEKWQSNEILRLCRQQNKRLAQRAEGLSKRIKRIGHSSPLECFQCLIEGYDYLDLWGHQMIEFQNPCFYSREQVNTFLKCFHSDS